MRAPAPRSAPALALVLLIAATVLAGCLTHTSAGRPPGEGGIAADEEVFTTAGAAPVGFRAGPAGADSPCAEFEMFAVYANGRAVHACYAYAQGDAAVHVTDAWFSREDLAFLFRPLATPDNPQTEPGNATVRVGEVRAGTVEPHLVVPLAEALAQAFAYTDGHVRAQGGIPGFCADCDGLGAHARLAAHGAWQVVHERQLDLRFDPVVAAFQRAEATFDTGLLREEYTLVAEPAAPHEGALALDAAEVRREAPLLAEALDAALRQGESASVSADAAPALEAWDHLDAEARAAGHRSFQAPPVNNTVAWRGEAFVVHLVVV